MFEWTVDINGNVRVGGFYSEVKKIGKVLCMREPAALFLGIRILYLLVITIATQVLFVRSRRQFRREKALSKTC